ncbi:MAG TPA: tetratricopeptide repeat protein [Holophaga sp.]|nr:tetratricopeptide repeat protein [Holophaga sp.]
MRAHLQYLLLDGFDPDTGELGLRVRVESEAAADLRYLRLKLHLGRTGDPLQPLRRELQTHVQMPVPPLWDRGLRIVIRAIEDELASKEGRDPNRYAWVQTQILHPTDERRGTLTHPIARQSEILWEWALRAEQEGDSVHAIELLERLLLLAPQHRSALEHLASLLRREGMVEELLEVADRLLALDPRDPEALLRRGECLLALGRHGEAFDAFGRILKANPVHPLAHLGAAQARSLGGQDPFPHLDAALELDREATLSVLRETFDFRILGPIPYDNSYPFDILPALLGVTPGEVQAFRDQRGLPVNGHEGTVREPELSRWVNVQNRYQLLPMALHWLAPTPRQIPHLPPTP